jgi:hypothetical protein
MIYQPRIGRDKGHASSLLKQLYEVAAQHDCKAVYLDSGHIRSEAHKLYSKKVSRLAHFILAKQFFKQNGQKRRLL